MSELDGLKPNPARDTTVYVAHYSRTPLDVTGSEMRYDAIRHEQYTVSYEDRLETPGKTLTSRECFPFAFERFKIVLHQPQFLRYAKKLIKSLLAVDPTSILVVDEQSGKVSGVWPTCDELRYRIRVDELEIFGMENGCVTVR